MLVKTLDKYELKAEFKAYDRDYYSLEACEAILEYFEEFDGVQDLDIIAICCDFNEEDEEEIRSNYDIPEDEEVMDYLNYNTYAIELSNSNILYIGF